MKLKDNFYRVFEEHFRGSRENIKAKQKIYIPFIEPIYKDYQEGIVLDIGCGRGEWLELLRDEGIPSQGVDLDSGMLEAARAIDLNVIEGDGIDFLQNMDSESAIAITAFHVAEHISFDRLRTLIEEAHRVLKSGGVLILETPNPENIRVACESFYMDPTHQKPIPSTLLAFLPEYYGFARIKKVLLNENEHLRVQHNVSLHHVIEGASQDYAVVAQKSATPERISLIDKAFGTEYGQHLNWLLEKFEQRMFQGEEKIDKIFLQLQKAEKKITEVEELAENTKLEYLNVINSYSWKLSQPLRWFKKVIKQLKN